jgi:hypothetical protein
LDPLSVLYVAIFKENHTGFAMNHLQSCPVSATTGGLTIQRSRQAADPVAFRTLWQIFVPSVLLAEWLFIKNCFDKWLFLTTRPCKKHQF